ncbi:MULTISPECIES: bifunctional diguanylate cyclase/phosphodiesterase [unclassified Ectothiorhodospira]|uniref:putative bifunctional diguanylate cyclase/phosphodiesterase n=1 Tax=unclassified Ectothiorhodospira TaxID=2684909 RepID=UPI001EE8CD44|nr:MULTISPECIES: EAL domain-containing protein [unclassified Ectothiorhodospira]MCG5516831.1 EAL domain-containing protein [Ectothiorhodospira sp. 9100]MCG5519815.1 EAL domain-containing protein [Ectothiorhodospira sp. 9905]
MDRLGLRITMAIAIPVVAFLIMAGIALGERERLGREMAATGEMAALATEGKALVHALQDERAGSVGYLSGLDNEFWYILEEARDATDELIEPFRERWQQLAGADGGVLPPHTLLDRVDEDLRSLMHVRELVNRQALHPLEVLPDYDRLIQRLILMVSHPPQTPADAHLSALFSAYRPLLLLKEHAARERALGNAWLGASPPDRRVFHGFLSSVAIQELQRQQFMSLAPPDHRDALLALESQPAHQELLATRAAIINHGSAGTPEHLNMMRWYGITRERVEQLRQMERDLAAEVGVAAERAEQEVHREFMFLLGIALVLLLLTVVLSVTIARGLIKRHRERLQALERMAYLTRHDTLTGLPNRSYFNELLEAWLETARPGGHSLALYLMDLEGFSEINRIWGESVADQVLVQVTERMREALHPDALLARIYGDQFSVVVGPAGPETKVPLDGDGEAWLPRLLACLDEPFQVGRRRIELRGNIGWVTCPPFTRHASELLSNAGFAVEYAKSSPRRRYRRFESKMLEQHAALVEMDRDLEKALEQHEFQVHYQPKLDLETGRVVSLEALLRWDHPQRGMVPPDEFIPRAEANGTIIEIGDYVLREACQQAQAWRQHLAPDLTVGVNLATLQLYQADIVERVRQILAESGLPPEALELELTETGLMEDMDAATEVLQRLRGLGISLSVDDFGTGYSSLAYLRRFPLQGLKLDKRFVSDLESSDEARMIATAVLRLARSLSLRSVAEGVETEAQAVWLRTRGCQLGQGYLYAPAMPPDAFVLWLGEEASRRAGRGVRGV